MVQMKWFSAKSRQATALRKRKFELVRRFGLPENALGGHLSQTRRRCAKPTCHCATGEGHPRWALSYSVEGRKQVEVLTEDLAAQLQPLVNEGREIREAVMELLAINLQLLRLWRQNEWVRAKRPKKTEKPKRAKQR